MITYLILSRISLGFLTPQDQYDSFFDPGEGYSLETDGVTIWVVIPVRSSDEDAAIITFRRAESITTANAIGLWVEEGKIAEVMVSPGEFKA